MFQVLDSASFISQMEHKEVFTLVEESLALLGDPVIDSSGVISISSSRYDGFGYTTRIDGFLRERDGSYSLDLKWQAQPDAISCVIAICFFPYGLLIFLLPYLAKGDMERKIKAVMNDICLKFNTRNE